MSSIPSWFSEYPQFIEARRRVLEDLEKLGRRSPKKFVKLDFKEKPSRQTRHFIFVRFLLLKYPNVRWVIPSVDWVRHKMFIVPKSINLLANLHISPEMFRDSAPVKVVENGVEKTIFVARFANHAVVSNVPFLYTIVRINEKEKFMLVWNYHDFPIELTIIHLDHGTEDRVLLEPHHFFIFLHEGLTLIPYEKMMQKLKNLGLSSQTLKTISKFYKSHGYKTPQYLYQQLEQRQNKNITLRALLDVEPYIREVPSILRRVGEEELARQVEERIGEVYRPVKSFLERGHEPPSHAVRTSLLRLIELVNNLRSMAHRELQDIINIIDTVLRQISQNIAKFLTA